MKNRSKSYAVRCRVAFLALISFHLFCMTVFGQDLNQEGQDLLKANTRIPVVAGSKGDVDGNGFIEIFDLIRARDIAIGRLSSPAQEHFFAADLNSDGAISEDDLAVFEQILLLLSEPPPTIFSIDPTLAVAGDQISISGAGFDLVPANNKVHFGEVSTEAISATEESILVAVPVGASTGTIVVYVGNRKSNPADIQITIPADAPHISEFTPPAALRGQTVAITGLRFGATQGTSELWLGEIGVEAGDILSWSDAEIVMRVPGDAFPGVVVIKRDELTSNGKFLTVTVVEVTAPDSADILRTAEGLEYIRNEVILDFNDDVALDEISSFLSSNDLTQVGIILRPRLIQARSSTDRNPFELAAELAPDPVLEGAFASVFSQLQDVASESFPSVLGSSYNADTGMMNAFVALNMYYHFAMRTFAGHRLVEVLLENLNVSKPDVRVAVVDDGLGNGTSPAPPEFEFRIKDPTVVGLTGFSGEVRTLAGIADPSGHGTAVSGFATGAGVVSLGTGKHVNLRPLQASQFAFSTAGAIEIAIDDPYVRVINLSLGTYIASSSSLANSIRKDASSGVYDDEIREAVSKGKIVIVAAGNEDVDARLSSPANLALTPGVLAVAGTRVTSDVTGNYEERWPLSNKGPVSVSAAASFQSVVLRSNYSGTSGSGTSFSAPLVAGLAGEMFLVDEILQRVGKRHSDISAQKVAEIIESTADDLGGPGPDAEFGHGRINVWKALLATVNGGLDSEVPLPDWIGIEIRMPVVAQDAAATRDQFELYKGTQVFLDGRLLSDFRNNSIPEKTITLFKRIPEPHRAPRTPYIPIPTTSRSTSQLMATFSITTDQINSGSILSKMQFRRKGESASEIPFLEFPLDLPNLRQGSLDAAKYDDFVYTAELPRLMGIRSVQDGNVRTVTETPMNQEPVVYPIAALGESIELDLAYPGYSPVVSSDIDIEYRTADRLKITKPDRIDNHSGNVVTNTVAFTVPDDAETGRIRIRTLDKNDGLGFILAPFVDLVVAKGAGFEPQGTAAGDVVTISINVPHFDVSTANTRVKFSGPNPEVVPDEVNPGSVTNVTHIIKVRIPDNLAEGPVSAILTVDDNRKVSFDVGHINLFEKTPFAGSLNFNQMQVTGGPVPLDLLPPSGKRGIPIRFSVNKNIEDQYFLSASIENGLFALGPDLTSALTNNHLSFSSSSNQQGSNSSLTIELDLSPNLQSATGSWRIEAFSQMTGVNVVFRASISADAETESPGAFNGFYPDRPRRISENGDAELIETLRQLLPAEPFLRFPLGLIQADGLSATVYAFQPTGAGGASPSAETLQKVLSRFPIAANGFLEGDFRLLNYGVGAAQGSEFTFIEDDAARFPYMDFDPNQNFITTYQLVLSGDNLSGTITKRMEVTEDDNMRSAELVYNYSGTRQKENEDDIQITALSPDPEAGFPPVTGNTVTLTSTTISFNLATADEGSIVLWAYSNDNPTAILAQAEMPISFTTNKAGLLTFDALELPGVSSSIRRISVVAGIKPSGASGFLLTSSAISYSR